MKTKDLKTISALIALLIALPSTTRAQSLEQMMQQNLQQQQTTERQLNQMMANGQNQAEAALQSYIQNAGPQLQAEYQGYVRATGNQIGLENYVRMKVDNEARRRMNAQGPQTNPIFESQKRQFEAGQKRYQERQQEFTNYNNNWANQQQGIDNSNARFIQQGIRGQQYYRNAETGQVQELPFAGSPGVYQNSNGAWVSPSMGNFQQVGPNGMPQQMEEYDPQEAGDD